MSQLGQIPKKKLGIMAVGAFVVPAVLGGGYLALRSSAKSEVSGTIQLGPPSAQKLAPNRCQSGILSEDAPRTEAQFHGVDLFDAAKSQRRVRVFDDPEKGKIVTIRDGEAAPVVVDRAACKRFEVKLKQTGAMILDRWGQEGSLALDCPEIVADVRFSSCYGGE